MKFTLTIDIDANGRGRIYFDAPCRNFGGVRRPSWRAQAERRARELELEHEFIDMIRCGGVR